MSGFFTKEEINPALNLLNINYEKVRDEFRAVKHQLVYIDHDEWKVAPLFGQYHPTMDLEKLEEDYDQAVYVNPEYEIIYTQNAVRMPTLFKLCLEAGIRQRCGISVLDPGKVIDWRVESDPILEDDIMIRGLWGIDINPQNQETCQLLLNSKVDGVVNEVMINNRMHFYWGRTNHHVFSNLSTPGVCLSFENIVPMDTILSK